MVVLPDANLLIYAYDERSDMHGQAKSWLETVMVRDHVILTWQTIMAFIRIMTSSRGSSPLPINDAIEIVEEWLVRDNVQILSFDKSTWPLVASTIKDGQAKGDLAMDAHLAAIALSCGATLATRDRDFNRFEGLRLIDPLAAKR